MTKPEADQKAEEYRKNNVGEFWYSATGVQSEIIGVLVEESKNKNGYKVILVCRNHLGEFPNEATQFFRDNHK